MNNTFKTKAGTELPLMNLKGNPYLQVCYRVVWMREEHPTWSIETDIGEFAVCAYVKDEVGRILANAHKSIMDKKAFAVEVAETGAIGRALALCGYGTAFCGDDLEEGEEIADAPISTKVKPQHSQADYPRANPNWGNEPCTEAQRKKLWAMAKTIGMNASEFKDWVVENFNVTATELLSKGQMNEAFKLIEDLESNSGSAHYESENVQTT